MLTDVWTKFRFFQKPANFDTRLAECERVLAGVKNQVGLLEIGSVEQDVVQSQLEQCMVGDRVMADGWIIVWTGLGIDPAVCLCLTEDVQGAE